MTKDELRAQAIALHDEFTHVTHDRRDFMTRLTLLAGSAVAANALLLGISPDAASAAIIPPDDKRLKTSAISWPGAGGRTMQGYTARLAGRPVKRPGVLVIHENRGLNDHIRDVARRVALAGYVAIAPDFLSPAGGTPADPDKAREMIGKLDLAAATADGVASIAWLARVQQSTGKIGAVGFCWGGAMTNRLAVAAGAALTAGVPYYGPAPAPAEAPKVKAAMLLHYAGNDPRVNASGPAWIAALKEAKADATAYTYEGAEHAFNNDTSTERYNAAVAKLAWDRTLAHFAKHLRG